GAAVGDRSRRGARCAAGDRRAGIDGGGSRMTTNEAIRIERDTFGPIEVPADRLWGAQTQRSLQFFAISTERMPDELVAALAQVKRAAAVVNRDLGRLDAQKADAIVRAAD